MATYRRVIKALLAFVRLSRLHFLFGGALMFALGAVTAPSHSVAPYAVGQTMVIMGQLTAHYVNEYADREADRRVVNRTWFSGGSGVLVEGSLQSGTALRAALATTGGTIITALGLTAMGLGIPATLGLVALLISWLYSMPPVRLLATGWGELAATTVVVVLVPLIGATSQGADPTPGLWWAMATLLPLHLGMMLGFELPDLDGDAAAGKLVLGVRLGRTLTKRAIVGALAVAAALLVLAQRLAPIEAPRAWSALIPGAMMAWGMGRGRHGWTAFSGVAVFATAGLALTLALA